jgi:Putative Flp pilus-assembly TadE/G-like
MLRRESGQILPGLVMLMLAILAIGMLAFTIGKAAVLRSGAQTAADAAALAGAKNIRDQLLAQMATTGTADLSRINKPLVGLAAARYARKNDARLLRFTVNGADVRTWVSTDEKIDPPKETRDGKASARARVELVTFQSLGVNFGGLGIGGGGGGGTGSTNISDKEWKELEKKLSKPYDCADMRVLADFFKAHGAIPPYENVYMGDPPMPPGGERDTTSRHYACGNSGAIDLNYPPAIEASVINEVRPHLIKLGFFTLWQVENHYDHMHIDFGSAPSPTGGAGLLGAAGSLTDSFLQVKLVDWDAPSATGIGAGFLTGPGGIPFGPPDPITANAICSVLDRMNVSPKVRLAAWETAIVESGVKSLPGGDRDSAGAFQQRPSMGWGSYEQVTNPFYATAAFVRAAERIEGQYANPGDLAQAVQRSDFGYRYAQRAGQAAALNDKFCG